MFTLDIYRQVWKAYKDRFDTLKDQFPEYIRYCGMVESDKSVDVLKNYYALLFPTYYEGEGFAGAVIDADSADVSIVASDLRYNSELINDSTGYIYPTGNQNAFVNILEKIGKDPTLMLCRKKSCIKEAQKYELAGVIKGLINQF